MWDRIVNLFRRMLRGFRDGLAECWALITLPFRNRRPGQWRAKLASDRADLAASSEMMFFSTKRTVGDIIRILIYSPIAFTRWLITSPRRIWFYLRTRTWLQLFSLFAIVAGLVGAAAGSYYFIRKEQKAKIIYQRYAARLEIEFESCNLEAVKTALEELQTASPSDSSIKTRLAAINSGVAPPGDAKMARLLMASHRMNGRLEDSMREARKHLTSQPRDWMTLIILAEHALYTGNRAEAARLVAQLPTAKEASTTLKLFICNIAMRVFQELGDIARLEELSDVLVDKVVPILKRSDLVNLDPGLSLQLIRIYVMTLRQTQRRPEVIKYWNTALGLADGVVAHESVTPGLLEDLGHQLDRMQTLAVEMERYRIISDSDQLEKTKAVDARLTKIWNRLRSKEPKNPFAYIGPAMQLSREDKPKAEVRATTIAKIDEGIKAIGYSPELIEKKAELLMATDARAALQFMDESLAGRSPSTPGMWKILTLSALNSGQTQRAYDAIQKAKTAQPGAPWLTTLEAEVFLQAGQATNAYKILKPLEAQIRLDPNATALYVRAMASAGFALLAEDFLNGLIDRPDSSQASILLGCETLKQAGQVDSAIKALRHQLKKDPNHFSATVLLADCLCKRADQRGWQQGEKELALDAFRVGARRFPDSLYFAQRISWLELTAFNAARQSYTDAALLRSASAKDLGMEGLRTRGATYIFNDEFEKGRIDLEAVLAIETAAENHLTPRVSTYALLALAFHGLNRPAEAKEMMAKAKAVNDPTQGDVEMIKTIEERMSSKKRS